jgi:hypothetical protein
MLKRLWGKADPARKRKPPQTMFGDAHVESYVLTLDVSEITQSIANGPIVL